MDRALVRVIGRFARCASVAELPNPQLPQDGPFAPHARTKKKRPRMEPEALASEREFWGPSGPHSVEEERTPLPRLDLVETGSAAAVPSKDEVP